MIIFISYNARAKPTGAATKLKSNQKSPTAHRVCLERQVMCFPHDAGKAMSGEHEQGVIQYAVLMKHHFHIYEEMHQLHEPHHL